MMEYPPTMDKECAPLCDALNLLPGILTVESCSGHGEDSFEIFFNADSLETLGKMVQFFHSCHNSPLGWEVNVYGLCCDDEPHFIVKGPTGKAAYESSAVIARNITKHLEEFQP